MLHPNWTAYTPRLFGVPPTVYSVGKSFFNGIFFDNNILLQLRYTKKCFESETKDLERIRSTI